MAKANTKKTPGVNHPTTPEEKKKALDTAMEQIIKNYGQGSVMFLGGEGNKKLDVESVPTGSIGLDYALGIGGLPKGRIIEIYGPESGGKTTVTLHAIAETQKLGGMAAFIDVEHALDPVYAKSLGVDIDHLIVSQPDTGEQALEIMETLARSGAIDIIVLDSVAAMVTKAEIDGEIGDSFDAPVPAEKAGYKFIGWYADESLTVPYDFGQKVEEAGEITIYAKWESTGEEKPETTTETKITETTTKIETTTSTGETTTAASAATTTSGTGKGGCKSVMGVGASFAIIVTLGAALAVKKKKSE